MKLLLLTLFLTGCATTNFCKDIETAQSKDDHNQTLDILVKERDRSGLKGKEAGSHLIKKLRSCGYDIGDEYAK